MVSPISPMDFKSPWYPIRERGDGLEGRGCWRKRMPFCNGVDRGYYDEFIVEDTQSERMLTSSRSEREKGFLKSSINHCIDTSASRNNVSGRKGKDRR